MLFLTTRMPLLPLCLPDFSPPLRIWLLRQALQEVWGLHLSPHGFLGQCPPSCLENPTLRPVHPGLMIHGNQVWVPRPPSLGPLQPHPPAHSGSQPPPQQLQEFQLLSAEDSGEKCFHLVQRTPGVSPCPVGLHSEPPGPHQPHQPHLQHTRSSFPGKVRPGQRRSASGAGVAL